MYIVEREMSDVRNGIFYAVFALTSCVSPALVVAMGPRVAMVVAGLAYVFQIAQ